MSLPCEQCAHIPTYHHAEALQAPYRPLWQALCARVTDLSPDMPIYQRDLNRWLAELWEEQPDAAAIFALRTTRYGRDDTD